jgi:hypothetical protein
MIFSPNATMLAAQYALGIEMEWSIVKNAKGHAACTLRHPQGMYTYTAYTQNGLQFLINEVIMPVYAATTNKNKHKVTLSITASAALKPSDPQTASTIFIPADPQRTKGTTVSTDNTQD